MDVPHIKIITTTLITKECIAYRENIAYRVCDMCGEKQSYFKMKMAQT